MQTCFGAPPGADLIDDGLGGFIPRPDTAAAEHPVIAAILAARPPRARTTGMFRAPRRTAATRAGRKTTARRTASHRSARTASTDSGGGEPGEPAGSPRSLDEVERRSTESTARPTPARQGVAP